MDAKADQANTRLRFQVPYADFDQKRYALAMEELNLNLSIMFTLVGQARQRLRTEIRLISFSHVGMLVYQDLLSHVRESTDEVPYDLVDRNFLVLERLIFQILNFFQQHMKLPTLKNGIADYWIPEDKHDIYHITVWDVDGDIELDISWSHSWLR